MIKILAFILFSTLFTFNVSHAKHLTVGWELWYPYQFTDDENHLTGMDIDIFKAIMKKAELDIEYIELPWKRHIQKLETGQIQLAMGASKSSIRNKFANFTIPYRKEIVNLYVLKGKANTIQLKSLEDLNHSSYMIGIEGGYYYGSKFQRLSKSTEFQSHINEVIDIEQNIQLLKQGHIDGFLADPATLNSFVKKHNITNQFEKHTLEIYQTDIHIMLSKLSTSSKLLVRLNQTITSMKANNEIEQIVEKWTNEKQKNENIMMNLTAK